MSEKEIQFRIFKPDDSQTFWSVAGKIKNIENTNYNKSLIGKMGYFKSFDCRPNRRAKDPVLGGIVDMFKMSLGVTRRRKYSYSDGPNEYKGILEINGFPILISKRDIRYELNGRAISLDTMCHVLARVLFKATTTDDQTELMSAFYSYLDMPEQIRYSLENKVPYHFFHEFVKFEVRMTVEQISDDEFAIEVSDGIWGSMTTSELTTFVNTYLHGKKRGSWYQVSPKNLFARTVGRDPSPSDLILMREFLIQNRTAKIVEERARDLVKELEVQHKDKIVVKWDSNEMPDKIFVRGNDYDWLLTSRGMKEGFQMVSTFIWQPISTEGTPLDLEPKWMGPICIDNMNDNSSLGDQFAGRVLAFINDNLTIKMVSTIKSRIKTKPNECRVDKNDVSRMWNE